LVYAVNARARGPLEKPALLMTNPTPVFKRILLKLSGEALAANQGFGVATERIHGIAAEIADVHKLGIQIAIVVGGGNFFRGVAQQAKDMDRVSADHMGMLATMINALALQDALEMIVDSDREGLFRNILANDVLVE